VSGNLVTYDDRAGNPSIRYHDLVTGTDRAIPPLPDGGRDRFSAVSGTTVVYVHSTEGETWGHIYAYDTATSGPAVELDPQPVTRRGMPAVGAATVAWQDYGFSLLVGPEIVAYDRATGVTTRLTNDALVDEPPAVDPSGTVITWAKCMTAAYTGCQVWDATLQGGLWTTHQLTAGSDGDPSPHTNGSVVVYGSNRDGEEDIRWQPVGGGTERSLSLPGHDLYPRVSGNLLSFDHYQDDASWPNWDIYAYDLSTNALYRLTSTPDYDEVLGDVWSDPAGPARVVWYRRGYDPDSNSLNVDVYELSFTVAGADTTAPLITIASPTDLAAYTLNQVVVAGYTCVDEAGGSGTASCQGTVPTGAGISTASVGTRTFSVSAADKAGNTSSRSVTYAVGYRICPLFDQTQSYHSGRTVPVKLQLCDASGANVSAAKTVLNATTLARKDNTGSAQAATDAGEANRDGTFRYDASLGGYIYNLSTKGLSSGTWVLSFTVAGDPLPHQVQFDVL
jgi:hypothetical protein